MNPATTLWDLIIPLVESVLQEGKCGWSLGCKDILAIYYALGVREAILFLLTKPAIRPDEIHISPNPFEPA